MSTFEPKQQAKTVIVTALISAVSTISVAVVPGLLRVDKVDKAVEAQEGSPGNLERKAPSDPRWRISGSVFDNATDKPISAQLFLMKADSVRQTDDGGKFVFDQVPNGIYWIQVEVGDSQGKHSNRYQISTKDSDDERKPLASGAWIKVQKEKESTAHD